jgi:NAD-dependent SIR2 family protein deacetylase
METIKEVQNETPLREKRSTAAVANASKKLPLDTAVEVQKETPRRGKRKEIIRNNNRGREKKEPEVSSEEEDDTPRKKCVTHNRDNWDGLSTIESTFYVREGGRYFGYHCDNCDRRLTTSKSDKNTTIFNPDNPARCCLRCKLYLVCQKCYTDWLLESDIADKNDPRISVKKTRRSRR